MVFSVISVSVFLRCVHWPCRLVNTELSASGHIAKPWRMTDPLPSPARPLKIGTRGSPLALWQAQEVRRCLMTAFDLPEAAFEIVVIKVTGDQILDRALKDIGGKGLFTREIEDALLEGSIDIAVHSMKDMPTVQPEGLVLDCHLAREDVRDAFVSPSVARLADLPDGAVVGSSSLRRRAQLAARRPDLRLVEFRGNVQTRLRKLDDGVAVATFLAMAGLNRLGLAHVARAPVEVDEMLPAVAQGAIGVERRAADRRVADRQRTRPSWRRRRATCCRKAARAASSTTPHTPTRKNRRETPAGGSWRPG
jgi:hydroxymethylbilane synthase